MKTIALIGNPNCGKTTIFNALTGANQHIGNWPGVTVEKKSGVARLQVKVDPWKETAMAASGVSHSRE